MVLAYNNHWLSANMAKRPEFCQNIQCDHYAASHPKGECKVGRAARKGWPTEWSEITQDLNLDSRHPEGREKLRQRCYRITVEKYTW